MKIKLLYGILFNAVLCLFCLPANAQTDVGDIFIANGFTYEITSAVAPLTVRITDYNTSFAKTVIIPETVTNGSNSYTLTRIGDAAFISNSLVSVTIPSSVTSIGYAAFRSNSIASVTIPSSVTSIGYAAFEANSLTSVTIPNSVTSIGEYAFSGNTLTTVISESTTPVTLLDNVFSNKNTIDLIIPEGTDNDYETAKWTGFKTISSPTFIIDGIQYLITDANTVSAVDYLGTATSVIIPEMVVYNAVTYTVNSIGKDAFFSKNLTSISIPNSVTTIGNNAFSINKLESLTIPNSLTSIGEGAFFSNNLTSVTIPGSVINIGDFAFSSNTLTTVISESTTPVTLLNHVFSNRNNIDLLIPEGLETVYTTASWTGFKSRSSSTFIVDEIQYLITDVNTVTAVDYLGAATSVAIPETVVYASVTYSVNKIGESAFRNKFLTSVTIPNTVISIGKIAFSENSLVSVTIPDSVTSIGNNAFQDNKLESVTIPNSITSIGVGTFLINKLTSVTIPNSVTSIDGGAFADNLLVNVTIPNSVISIGDSAFSSNLLVNVTIPNSVTNIGNFAFWENPLTTVTSESTTPVTLLANVFSNRNTIDLIIPEGTATEYTTVG